jgi:hypothetical protein
MAKPIAANIAAMAITLPVVRSLVLVRRADETSVMPRTCAPSWVAQSWLDAGITAFGHTVFIRIKTAVSDDCFLNILLISPKTRRDAAKSPASSVNCRHQPSPPLAQRGLM